MSFGFRPFHTLLMERSEPDLNAYWTLCGDLSKEASLSVKERVARVRLCLRQTKRKRLILFCEDRGDFLIHLWAALLESLPVVIPQTGAALFLKRLLGPSDALYCDHKQSAESQMWESHDPLIFRWKDLTVGGGSLFAKDFSWTLNPSQAQISFFSSGSSSEPKLIHKTLHQLEKEVGALENLWGGLLRRCPVLSFVPPYHLYGFLFSVLWPLSRGQIVKFRSIVHWAEVWDDETSKDQEFSQIIVATPSYLSRMPSKAPRDLRSLRSLIFSSASPLSYESAQEVSSLWGQAPIEIYGSTETGGIGYRQQNQPNKSWAFLPGVSAQEDDSGRWWLQSPFLNGLQPVMLEDRLEEAKGGFRLLGRMDRLVKIEGKRVSLDEVESCLNLHEFVEKSYVLPWMLHRECLGVVLVLSDQGEAFGNALGLKEVLGALKKHLRLYIHASMMPRRWRVVDQIPKSAMGKVLNETLKNLLETPSLFQASLRHEGVFSPKVLSWEKTQNQTSQVTISLSLEIPSDLYYLKGHFPDFPLVPGVVLFHWAVEFARVFFNLKGSVLDAQKIKFMALVHPKEVLNLTLLHDLSQHKVRYHYEKGSSICASGEWAYQHKGA